jgi:hypothetical protein
MQVLYQLLSGAFTAQERIEKIKDTILELKSAIALAPERFLGLGAVPIGLSDNETEEWVQKYVISNDFKGVGEFTPGNKIQIEQLEPVLIGWRLLPLQEKMRMSI